VGAVDDHSSIIARLGPRVEASRPTIARMDVAGDPAALRRLAGWAFVCGLCLAALAAILALLSGSDAEGVGQVLAALLVLALLATVLPPILRRLSLPARSAGAPAALAFGAPARRSPNRLAEGVSEEVERLGGMDLPPQARTEVARLHELVREAGVQPISRRSRT
jgi:hypothetical protein